MPLDLDFSSTLLFHAFTSSPRPPPGIQQSLKQITSPLSTQGFNNLLIKLHLLFIVPTSRISMLRSAENMRKRAQSVSGRHSSPRSQLLSRLRKRDSYHDYDYLNSPLIPSSCSLVQLSHSALIQLSRTTLVQFSSYSRSIELEGHGQSHIQYPRGI